jgi:cation diffusion facilitator CzcD-associated flavoprotein CzcO
VGSPSSIIIGAGFGGMAAAIELKKAGYDDIVILEKGGDVGGVWRANTYPGAACDVPSPFYSYSFAPNPEWPQRYSPQPAILDYARKVAADFDLTRHLRLNTEVVAAEWNDATAAWHVLLEDGTELRADVLVPAVGQLSRPAMPKIKGRTKFRGPSFHSAEWDHSVGLAGKRVAVIGTGASAVQFVPAIQPEVAELTVFQRTGPYLGPRMDTAYGKAHHLLFAKVPVTQLTERIAWAGVVESLSVAWLYSQGLSKGLTRLSKWHMKRGAKAKPGLFEKVWPDYPIGCKRLLFSDEYLPALAQENVDLVTDDIAEITATGVRTVDGVLHEADVIIYGTGFTSTEFLAPIQVVGRGGAELSTHWAKGAHAYYGLTVPTFPNLVLMYGPNTNTGGGSVIYFHEIQAKYLRAFVDAMVAEGSPLEVKADIESDFDRRTQEKLNGSVWTQCHSWYTDKNGRISTNWPGLPTEYRRQAVFKRDDYTAAPAGVRA